MNDIPHPDEFPTNEPSDYYMYHIALAVTKAADAIEQAVYYP